MKGCRFSPPTLARDPWKKALLAVSCAAALGGCVSETRGYAEVQSVVKERTGQAVRWRRVDPDVEKDGVDPLLRRPLTAETAVELALRHSYTVQGELEALRAAQAQLLAARRPTNPEVELFLGSSRGKPRSIELRALQEVTGFLLIPASNEAASTGLSAAALAAASHIVDFVYDVKRAFFSAAVAEERLRLARQTLAARGAALDAAREVHRAGNISDLEVVHHEASHEEALLGVEVAEAEASQKKEALTGLLGVWEHAALLELDPLALEQARGKVPAPVDLVRKALDANLTLRYSRLRLEAQGKELDVRKTRGFLPKLHAGVGANRAENAWEVGPAFALEVPLWDQGQGPVALQESELFRDQRLYQDTGVRVRTAARKSGVRLLARERVWKRYAEKLVPLRKQASAETLLAYNAMAADVFQLLAAKEAELEAHRLQLLALGQLLEAGADVEQLLAGGLPSH